MDGFPEIRFRGTLRPSQVEVVAIAENQLAEGERHLHIVAPPGTGKTVVGLYLWAHAVRRPAVVFSPNSAIQAQWADRTDLFQFAPGAEDVVSTDAAAPGLLTSLTYQSVTMPRRGGPQLDAEALELWHERLIEKAQAADPQEAQAWTEDLARHNRDYYDARLGHYRKRVRDEAALAGQALEMLHASARATLERLRERGVGLIVLDECHHLMGHWGRVLADAHDLFAEPVVLGLTATPPDDSGQRPEDVTRYASFFGPVDYEVPVPAVVKDGFLAPYQDLAWFVRPTAEELAFIASADEQLHALVEELCAAREEEEVEEQNGKEIEQATDEEAVEKQHAAGKVEETPLGEADEPTAPRRLPPLPQWLSETLATRRLPTGTASDWLSFERRDSELARAARLFLMRRQLPLPEEVPELLLDMFPEEVPEMVHLVPVLDRYVRHGLRRSPRATDHELAEKTVARLRTLGVQITESGPRACASPVGRVLAYSRNKTAAVVPILRAERAALGEKIRAVVVTDYEKTSATSAEVAHLLDAEAGGAVAAFRTILGAAESNPLDPILVTGSSVLVDDDLRERFDTAAEAWLAERGYDVQLRYGREEGFQIVRGEGSDWCPRTYVAMITDLFQQGVTRCLVGTRGLLGEGWDASRINVLVDLTTVTTSMSVQQLRGRSIRIDRHDPEKVANNWDVVCLAPEFSKGLDDYDRFRRKHATIYGVTDDGQIEKGVAHVHPAFSEMKPAGLEGSTGVLNADMLARAARRDEVRAQWKIGEPYQGRPVRTLEAQAPAGGGFPAVGGGRDPWTAGTLTAAIGEAVLAALVETGRLARRGLHVGKRSGGWVRVFLEEASAEESETFTTALHEALGRLQRPRYVIPRQVDRVRETWLSGLLPGVLGRYFRKRERQMAMLHAVPTELARHRDLVAVYQRHWNRLVSPGEALYAHRGEGAKLLAQAHRDGTVPRGVVEEREVWQ